MAMSSEKTELLYKLENAEKEIMELKKRRSEDAKANNKVVGIFATREQSWLHERKNLRRQIGALINDLRVLQTKNEDKLRETDAVLQSKDKLIDEAEDKLNRAEAVAEELRQNAEREAQRHSSEISNHKTAFMELVSNQRGLEAEMGRAVRQVEAAKHELDSVLGKKEQLVLLNQRLSMELVKMRNDLEQKDQILSAMLRKSKLDTAEKELLLQEVKSSKAKRKQAEMEIAKRYSFRNMLSKHISAKTKGSENIRNGLGVFALVSDPYSTDKTEEPSDLTHLDNWVNAEAEKYKIAVEQRHHHAIDAFVEQLRLKDDKLEAYRWRLMSMEMESNTLQSHVEGLDLEIAQLRQDNVKLEAVLLDREKELHSLKEQLLLQCLNPPNHQNSDFNVGEDPVWSKVKVVKRRARQETKAIAEEIVSPAVDIDEMSPNEQLQDIVLTLKSPNKEIKGEGLSKTSNDPPWKMDIQALGVSYKVKRLKQQMLVLERLTGKRDESLGAKELYALMSFLNKQIDRYQSLQGKIDGLCIRMHEKKLNLKSGGSSMARPEDETKRMEQFLEETFQLQRYMVATGQKLMEVQSKIASGFGGEAQGIEKPASCDMKRFADTLKALFQEVQRGLEVRISRIIGDLEGTLACDRSFY